MIRNSVILGVLIIFVLTVSFGCSGTDDKFVGKWFDEKGELNCEITKNGDKYKWQTFHKKEKMASYDELFISEEGYLLHDWGDRYIGFKYVDDTKIKTVTIWKITRSTKPSEGEFEEGYELTRGTEND